MQAAPTSDSLPWSRWVKQAAAIVFGVGAGMGLRVLLVPWLANEAPFITAFPTVAAVAFFGGVAPGAIAAALCAVWVLVPGLPPEFDPILSWRQLVVFLPASFVVAFFAGQASPMEADAERRAVEAGRPGAIRWLKLSMVLAVVLPTVFMAIAGLSLYRSEMDAAFSRVDRLSQIGVEHASKVVETNEAIARNLLNVLGRDSLQEARERESALHAHMRSAVTGIDQIQSVWIVGADGHMVASNRVFPVPRAVDFSDREGLSVHATGVIGPFVTRPMVGRVTGEPFFDVTLRWSGPGGTFNGAVWVSLHPSYFTEFYQRLAQDEPGLAVALLRDDGAVLARWPAPRTHQLRTDSPVMSRLTGGQRRGSFRAVSSIDGIDRIVSFRAVDRYPLIVVASIETSAVAAVWQRQLSLLAAFTFPTAMALVYIAWVALRRTRRELEAVRELQFEMEQREIAENSLRQMQKLEALGRLTGGVAHDFNNLLMVVNNNLHLLRRLDPSLERNPQLGAIGRAVSSGERLTRQLLAFARRQPLHPEVVSLQERLPALLALVAPTLGPRIESRVEVERDTAPVEVDPAELELAVINLAINAKDAMPNGGRLTLKARNAPKGTVRLTGDFVEITVTDTGTGIEPQVLDRVFEPFYTTKPPGQGTGLGLSQVYGLCSQAGGTARISTPSEGGTRVHMLLPASRSTAAPVSPPVFEDEALDCAILLVEDNADLAEVTRALLQTVECTVEWADSGEAARQMIDENPKRFEMVISDMAMPGAIDGLALAEYLRASHPHLPIVLMTGYASQLHEASARRFTVLAKPCEPETLIAVVRDVLRKRRSETEKNARPAGIA